MAKSRPNMREVIRAIDRVIKQAKGADAARIQKRKKLRRLRRQAMSCCIGLYIDPPSYQMAKRRGRR